MDRPSVNPSPTIYSTPSPAAVADFVAQHYDLPGPLACTLLQRGFNDCFELRAPDGSRVVLRLSGSRLRGEPDVASETAFIAHLDGLGVPVAAPIRARDGSLFTRMSLPQGQRPAVLFRFAEGRVPENTQDDARLQGETLARIHAAAEGFAGRDEGRCRNDLDGLLHAPVSAILDLPFVTAEQRDAVTALAARLAAAVAGFRGLSWTRCHGDCHGRNARIATQGGAGGRAVFFDFDDGGPGYLAYDLAVFLWAQVSFGRRGTPLWHAFIDGYRALRPITPADYECANVFVPIRHLWLMGEWASRTAEWGSEALSATWLDTQLDFLRSWQRDRLSPGLLDHGPPPGDAA